MSELGNDKLVCCDCDFVSGTVPYRVCPAPFYGGEHEWVQQRNLTEDNVVVQKTFSAESVALLRNAFLAGVAAQEDVEHAARLGVYHRFESYFEDFLSELNERTKASVQQFEPIVASVEHEMVPFEARRAMQKVIWEECMLSDNEWTTWTDAIILAETAAQALTDAGYEVRKLIN